MPFLIKQKRAPGFIVLYRYTVLSKINAFSDLHFTQNKNIFRTLIEELHT